jgi:hypothetical protein
MPRFVFIKAKKGIFPREICTVTTVADQEILNGGRSREGVAPAIIEKKGILGLKS